MGKSAFEYCQNVDSAQIDEYVQELNMLCRNYNRLSESEKGALIGAAIGKNGIDFFAGSKSLKVLSSYRNLKKANALCNLEAIAASNTLRKKFQS